MRFQVSRSGPVLFHSLLTPTRKGSHQAQSWDNLRRVIAKFEWHPGELFPRVGFIATYLPMAHDGMVRFYNQRCTTWRNIKEGDHAFCWTRLSCTRSRASEVRLQLHALAHNLATFFRCTDPPIANSTVERVTFPQPKLNETGGTGLSATPKNLPLKPR